MRIQRSSRQGCVVLTLAGRLDLAAAPQLQREILKQLAEPPPVIICDLGQVEAIDPLCAGVFTAIRHPALGWPGTALVLCGAGREVADTLVRVGVARYLAMYPSLEQALANASARPPWLRERLALGPVPTAAPTGRAFVLEVCGRWGIQALAGSAALLASELVTLAVVHTRTALELRVELHGPRLHVAVHDQDPNVMGLLTADDGADTRLSLLIVDRVATAWGVRQDEAGGKTAWFTLDLPPQEADTGAGQDRVAGLADPDLLWGKLWPPAPREGVVPRAGPQLLLQAGLQRKLCLLSAPAGSGKTTLLTQCRAVAGADRVAWVSLDEGDNDPARFWMYVVEAIRTVEPSVGAAALAALRHPGVNLWRVALPGLLNELRAIGSPLVLVLDDYQLVTNATCHQTLGLFLEHLPAGVHVALSTRVDPPLPLARLRARGELAELRAADLRFTDQEAAALLNGSMGLRLGAEDIQRLAERTEGWAAGLVLAGLSLRGRQDPSAFVASFHGDNRHVADYLGAEVLQRQPAQVRRFLLRTSIQLTGRIRVPEVRDRRLRGRTHGARRGAVRLRLVQLVGVPRARERRRRGCPEPRGAREHERLHHRHPRRLRDLQRGRRRPDPQPGPKRAGPERGRDWRVPPVVRPQRLDVGRGGLADRDSPGSVPVAGERGDRRRVLGGQAAVGIAEVEDERVVGRGDDRRLE